MAEILYQGHGSFRMTTNDGKVVYIDPFAGEGYDKPADLILVTHQHHDHNCISLCPNYENCVIFQNSDAIADGKYIPLDFDRIHIEPTQAYNKNHERKACVGYLINVDGMTLYFAGDTSKTEEMSSLAERNIDYAFLPTDGVFNMDIPEAIECAKLIHAKHTVPVHIAPGKLFDAKRAEKFTAPGALVLKPGETIEF